VLGVVPPSFRSPVEADIWLVVDFSGPAFAERGINGRTLRMVGRLAPDKRVADARVDLETISRRLQLKYPATNEGFIARPVALSDSVVGRVRSSLWTLLAGAFLVWLIGAVNGSFLFAANVARRRQDLAIRGALGARFRSLEGQILLESLMLSAIGGGGALCLTRTSLGILRTLPGLQLPRLEDANVDPAVLMALGVMTLVSALFVGFGATAFGVPRHLALVLRQGSATADVRLTRWRRWLMFAQVVLGSALLVLALQSGRTYVEIQSTPPGFDVSNLLTFDLTLPQGPYPDDASVRRFTDNLVETMHTVPGIRHAAVTSILPLGPDDNVVSFAIEGRPDDPRDPPVAAQHIVSREYFDALRIPLVAGRSFSDIETRAHAPFVVVVSQRLAERYFPGGDAVGRTVVVDVGEKKRAAIIGVTGSVRFTGLDRPPAVEMFLSADQFPLGVMSVVVRTDRAPTMLTRSVMRAVHELDRGLALAMLQPMDVRLAASVARPRVQALALGGFAAVALLLAFAGVFALIRYDIACRRREIVTRVALGATPDTITRALVGQSLRLGVLGVGCGLTLAALLSRLTASQIYGVTAPPPSLLALSGMAMCGVVALASFTAARRVASLQPSEALRQV
jgi:putative ABC transport system permease protein